MLFGFPGFQTVENLPAVREELCSVPRFKIPCKSVHTHASEFLFEEFMDRGASGSYSPWVAKANTTEQLTLSYIFNFQKYPSKSEKRGLFLKIPFMNIIIKHTFFLILLNIEIR